MLQKALYTLIGWHPNKNNLKVYILVKIRLYLKLFSLYIRVGNLSIFKVELSIYDRLFFEIQVVWSNV